MKFQKGHVVSEETRSKISAALMGRTFSEDTINKMSERKKGRPAWNKGKSSSTEARHKLSLSMKKAMLNPATRKKLSDANKLERHPQWKGGLSFEPYCPKFTKEFKERVRAFFDYRCVECGTPQNGKKLAIHHVNFNKMTCCDGTKPLFVPLCNSCHTKTNFNRDCWERHFIEIIEIKYDGNCYGSANMMGVGM